MVTDEGLLLEFQRGSHEALEELFARYGGVLNAFFVRRIANQHRAEDLVQETFIAVIKGSARYEPRSSVRAYLFGIAFKVLFAERRSTRDCVADSGVASNSIETIDLPDRALWVRSALLKLDEGDREIIMLREFEQLSYSEISNLLRLPVNTVRSRLFRARAAIKELLEPLAMQVTDQGGH